MKTKKAARSRPVVRGPRYATRHDGREWTGADDQLLKKLLKVNTPIQLIGLKLGRSLGSVRYHVKRDRLALKSIPRE